jgi:hypothetical protein
MGRARYWNKKTGRNVNKKIKIYELIRIIRNWKKFGGTKNEKEDLIFINFFIFNIFL